jgi:hypothetical protein
MELIKHENVRSQTGDLVSNVLIKFREVVGANIGKRRINILLGSQK